MEKDEILHSCHRETQNRQNSPPRLRSCLISVNPRRKQDLEDGLQRRQKDVGSAVETRRVGVANGRGIGPKARHKFGDGVNVTNEGSQIKLVTASTSLVSLGR